MDSSISVHPQPATNSSRSRGPARESPSIALDAKFTAWHFCKASHRRGTMVSMFASASLGQVLGDTGRQHAEPPSDTPVTQLILDRCGLRATIPCSAPQAELQKGRWSDACSRSGPRGRCSHSETLRNLCLTKLWTACAHLVRRMSGACEQAPRSLHSFLNAAKVRQGLLEVRCLSLRRTRHE